MNLPNELEKMAAERGLWSSGDRIVVAVSGGPDSMALLHMLSVIAKESGLSIIAAHANHGFRIEESAHELLVVQAFAKQLGVICETTCLDMPSYIEETRMKGRAASRVRRYAFCMMLLQSTGLQKLLSPIMRTIKQRRF